MIGEISGDFLQWLRGFCSVAEEGSVRQAVIAMGREKSTISRQIQCLEKELGITLFDRSSGKMVITPEGKILQEEAVALFEYVKRIKGEFNNNEEISYRGKITIAATHAIIYNILPPYIDHFQRLYPDVTFQIEGGTRERVLEKIESAESDLGITFFETGYNALECHGLFEAGLVMVVPKNKPCFRGKALPTLRQIAEAPLILFGHRGVLSPLVEERFTKSRLKPNVVMTHNNFLTIKKYVARGMGVAILSEHTISPEDEQNFNLYSLNRYFPKRKYGILLKKKKYLSAMVKAFIRTIKPEIDFSANPEPLDAPAPSLTELLRRQEVIDRADASTVKSGRGKKR